MKKANLMLSAAAISVILMTGCNSKNNSTDDATATFKDSPVEGLSYSCTPSGVTGLTTSEGKLTCKEGDKAEFQLGAMTFGPVSVRENDVITPYRIYPDNEEAAVNLAQLLQSLDDDGIYDETITLAPNKLAAVTEALNLEDPNFDTLASTMLTENNSSLVLVSEEDAQAHLNESIADTTAPIVTLLGDEEVEVILGETYTEAGATANDDVHGMMTPVITGTVDTSTLGTYTITYSATDAAANTDSATRTVTVVEGPDVVAPVVTLEGGETVTIAQNSTYTDAGATAEDVRDGMLTPEMSGEVSTAILGTYTITWTATDEAGNVGTATRTVIVEEGPDEVSPVVTLTGEATVTITVGETYTEAGATATDNVDGTLTPVISGSVDTSTAGTYVMTYTATDAAGNESSATRTVTVEEETGPTPTTPDELEASAIGDTCIASDGTSGTVAKDQDPFGNVIPNSATCEVDAEQTPTPTSAEALEASSIGDACVDSEGTSGVVAKDQDPFGNVIPNSATCTVAG